MLLLRESSISWMSRMSCALRTNECAMKSSSRSTAYPMLVRSRSVSDGRFMLAPRYVDALARTEFASVLRCCVYLVSVDAVDEEVELAVVD